MTIQFLGYPILSCDPYYWINIVDISPIWVWVNTYGYIFSGMNIHLSAILGFTRYQGFDPSPFLARKQYNPIGSPVNLYQPVLPRPRRRWNNCPTWVVVTKNAAGNRFESNFTRINRWCWKPWTQLLPQKDRTVLKIGECKKAQSSSPEPL